jgi:DNA-directed RNA polymerase subunit RPC12/RpoP
MPTRYKCGECGSERWERFSDEFRSGMRCKECGHEKLDKEPAYKEPAEPIKYVWKREDRITF